MSAQAWGSRRTKPRGVYIGGGMYRSTRRAELARERRMATQQRRIDRRYDRHEFHGERCALAADHALTAAKVQAFLGWVDEALTPRAAWLDRVLAAAITLPKPQFVITTVTE